MNGQGRELHHLLELALDKSLESRRLLTATIGDLFNERGTVLTDRERALISDILRKLIRECEMAVRRDLSERLAKAPDPPHDLIVALANDDIEVAAPILLQSEMLLDVELVQIIRHRTQQHQLTIAMRRSVSEPVSDALVETGSIDVIKALLENQDARISEATMAYLAEQSQRVDSYQEPLIMRRNLKPELAERMYLWVSAALRQHILENFDVNPSALDDQLESVAGAISKDPQQHGADPEASQPAAVLAQELARQEKITPDMLVQVLRQGEIPLFEALFGRYAQIPPQRLHSVLYDAGGESLALVCRSLNMPKSAFATIFLLSGCGRSGKRIIEPRELSRALLLFDRIKPESAQEVLKSWRRDPTYQAAIEDVAAIKRQQPKDR